MYARRLDDHAVELAEHFGFSSDPEDLEKAVHYGELAAQRDMATYAYSEAVHHLEQAVDVQSLLNPDDETKRCDLLLALGEALTSAGEPKRAVDTVLEEAFAIADSLNDAETALKASTLAQPRVMPNA